MTRTEPVTFDLCEPHRVTFAAFCAQIATLAYEDHEAGRKAGRTGEELCREFAEGYLLMHRRLASTVYNQTRQSLRIAERERDEAGL